jgi:mono/diheme cytochrome c family protein
VKGFEVRLKFRECLAAALALTLACASAAAQDNEAATKRGSQLYGKHCAACHGARMVGPEWAIDLKTFPKSERARFFDSVTHGKAGMPPWGDLLKQDDIAALWAYVVSGGESQ